MFRDHALFAHLDVIDNIAHGLMIAVRPRNARHRAAEAAREMAALPGYGARRPSRISGGQRQRAVLSRAQVNRSRVLPLDEPLGALDPKLREQMQEELGALQRKLGIAFVFLTHDQTGASYASGGVDARGLRRSRRAAGAAFRHVLLPLSLPGMIAGSIFPFSLTPGGCIIPQIIGTSRLVIGQAVHACQGTAVNIPLVSAFAVVPVVIMGVYLRVAKRKGARGPSMRFERAPPGLKIAAGLGLAFLHLPILLIFVHAFTTEGKSYQGPPPGFTVKCFGVTWARPDVCQALSLSLRAAAVSTAIALVRDTRCAAAASRSRLCGREAISLKVILPIALPGIGTGISLRAAFNLMDIPCGFWPIVPGNAPSA